MAYDSSKLTWMNWSNGPMDYYLRVPRCLQEPEQIPYTLALDNPT